MSFDWKQEIRRRLLALHIARDVTTKLIMNKKGSINLLTVVPIVEIENNCIQYIRKHFDEGLDKKKFDYFWGYFEDT
jgi:hypothetical protein